MIANHGGRMELYKEIRELSDTLEAQLKKQIDSRVLEMDDDDTSHYLIYASLEFH